MTPHSFETDSLLEVCTRFAFMKRAAGMEVTISRSADMSEAIVGTKARGNLVPELVRTGRTGSSLLAAIATAISSFRFERDAQQYFNSLSDANKVSTNTWTDSPKHAGECLRVVRNLKLSFLEGVEFTPLIRQVSPGSSREEPLAKTYEAIDKGSAVIFPVRAGSLAEIPRGRTSWATITGYEDKSIVGISRNYAGECSQITNFTLGIPYPEKGAWTVLRAERLNDILGSANSAYVVSGF